MKRIAVMACVVLGLAVTAGQSFAGWSECTYSGYQPWYNIFAKDVTRASRPKKSASRSSGTTITTP